MPTDRNALPDDVETLKRLVIGRDEMIAKLMVEIARLKRWRFGQSAERVDATLVQCICPPWRTLTASNCSEA